MVCRQLKKIAQTKMKMLTNNLIESPEILPTTNAPYKIWTGDNLDLLDQIPDSSVDSIVTDPPYGLGKEPDAMQLLKDWIESGVHTTRNGKGFMNKEWDAFVPQPALWKKCLRVLKPGGHLLAFGGTRTYDLVVLDQIACVYGNGFPKSLDIGKKAQDMQGWGTGLKPCMEPIVVARKPLIGTVVENVNAFGTGGMNIKKSRTGEGRWPGNFVHDGSEEVLEAFPDTKAGGSIRRKTGRSGNLYCYGEMPARSVWNGYGDSGSAARFFYCAKATRKDRNEGLEDPGPQFKHGTTLRNVENTETKGNNHPTVKPIVLDPFMGSGSTGKAAMPGIVPASPNER